MRKPLLLATAALLSFGAPAWAQQGVVLPGAPRVAIPAELAAGMRSVTPSGLGELMAPANPVKPAVAVATGSGAQSAMPLPVVPASVAPVAPALFLPTAVPVAEPARAAPVPGGPVPPSPADASLDAVIQQLLPPLNADQTLKLRLQLDERRKAQERPLTIARPASRSLGIALKPGEVAPTLRLSPGNASVITFSDQTGAQWPVQSVTVGNAVIYNAQQAGEQGKTNIVVVSPLSREGRSNLVVTLVGYPVPAIFTLETGSGDVDYRLDINIQARGPNAVYDIIGGTILPPTNDPAVQAVLDGTPPRGARKVHTSSRDVEAWRYQDMLFVRTQLELLSPAYVARAHNISGINVYTMIDAPSLIVSQEGRMASVTVDR